MYICNYSDQEKRNQLLILNSGVVKKKYDEYPCRFSVKLQMSKKNGVCNEEKDMDLLNTEICNIVFIHWGVMFC